MITPAHYRQLTSQIPDVNLTEFNIGEYGRTLALPKRTISLITNNFSEAANRAFVRQIMASGLLPKEAVTFSSVELTYCELDENSLARRVSESSIHLYQMGDNNEIISNKMEDFESNNKNELIICSTNETRDYSGRYSGKQILRSLQGSIRETLPYIPSLSSVEWRFEGIENYMEEEINEALTELHKAGYQFRIDPPYNIANLDGETRSCTSCQPLSIRLANRINPSSTSDLFPSALSIQREWINGNPATRLPLEQPSLLNVEHALQRITEHLNFYALRHPLVNRAAVSVRYVGNLPVLLQRLTELGYSATLDVPFINSRYFCEQYILIDLPNV